MPIQSHPPPPLPLMPEKMGLLIRKVTIWGEDPSKERFAVYGNANTWNCQAADYYDLFATENGY